MTTQQADEMKKLAAQALKVIEKDSKVKDEKSIREWAEKLAKDLI